MLFSRRRKVSSSARTVTRRRRGVCLTLEPLEERNLLQGDPLLVITNADSGPGSLRDAITMANTMTGPTTIDFAIGSGPQTIAILSPLPLVNAPVVLDGTSQPGYGGTPLITLTQSSMATGVTDGLNLFASGSTVEGLMITGFTGGIGIAVTGNNETVGGTASGVGNVITGNQTGLVVGGVGNLIAGSLVSGNVRDGVDVPGNSAVVEGNRIGTNADGTAAMANGGNGVSVVGLDDTIGGTTAAARNVISGNGANGVNINAGHMGDTLVEGNYIGTNAVGSAAVPNLLNGVADSPAQSAGASNGTTIGGTAQGAGNVISGNKGYGVLCGFGDLIEGNLIGTDAAGSVAVGNGASGIGIFVPGANTIGGTAAGAGNVISGNAFDGISLQSGPDIIIGPTSNNLIQGNKIGTNQFGTKAIPNLGQGISLSPSTENTIGGAAPGAGNIISGNAQSGIVIRGMSAAIGTDVQNSNNNVVQGNLIGVGTAGTAVANGMDGIQLLGDENFTTIGGTSSGTGNTISGNSRYGIYIPQGGPQGSAGLIEGNRIGTNLAGTTAVPNGVNGIDIVHDFYGRVSVGGLVAGAANIVSGNTQDGIEIDDISASKIVGNKIGTDVSGAVAVPNGVDGVYLSGGGGAGAVATIANQVMGNLVSGNIRVGVLLMGRLSSANLVQGNVIGLSQAGGKLPNGQDGVALEGGANGNAIGGFTAGASNTISGNGRFGVYVDGSTTMDNYIQGNFIGTSADGMTAEGNALDGVAVFDGANHNLIGNTAPDPPNVISGNGRDGIFMDGAGPTNTVEGNLIGLNAAGSAALPNHGTGVALAYTPNTFVGTRTSGAGNVISGNLEGVVLVGLGTTGNVVEANLIGTDKTGNAAVANTVFGVDVLGGASGNVIGGTDHLLANTIAFNGRTGVVIGSSINDTATTGNAVLGNSIFSNAFQGIDLGNDGPTANTPGGPHLGPNHLQNFPVIRSVTASGSGTAITVALNSTPGHGFRIELFADADGQGRTFLGAGSVATDGNGNGGTIVTVATAFASLVGQRITATATDTTTGDTSEFSFPAFAVSG